MKKNDYSYEFEVFTNFVKEEIVPVWKELTKDEQEQFRQEYPESPLVPTRIKVGEEIQEVVIRKDALCKRRIPNILKLTISELLGPNGKMYRNRFLISESAGVQYMVKGKYKEFKDYLDNLRNKNQIGFK